ncbi:batten's disease protein Cln3 [Pluteus cervinus]|uniref:Batten's disease protein Cln3 n=1 Tax=Pluteus cervinus TaxID=181527 RepID=A0ACD3BCK8_9AGAR|nr:batten's disease protein Cln3 [Pluteus cervinus]
MRATTPHPSHLVSSEDNDQEERSRLLPEDTDTEDAKDREKRLFRRLGLSFFLFGLINNVLYVIILSAALDLVPPSTPKGIIAFCNIAPALVAKVGWPYVLKGRIRYAKRIIGCALLSVVGMIVVALFDTLLMRLLGICLASFSSGLGELTFLQLSTTYAPPSVGGHSVGYFASGTGAAGLVGAFLWWEVRSFGVRIGVGVSSVLPFILPLAYFYLLPSPAGFLELSSDEQTEFANSSPIAPYAPIPTEEVPGNSERNLNITPKRTTLSLDDKIRLVKPLLVKYMLPLFCVYTFEYTINQGVAPTLLYPVPEAGRHWVLGKIIHSVRDYYPLWQLVYQTTVFISRSTISLGIPPLPQKLLSVPAIVQGVILLVLSAESAIGFFADSDASSIIFVFLLISLEGVCGGLAYVNVFYRINQERPDPNDEDLERIKQEREFKIGSVGFADSSGILLASLLAVPTEIELCKTQVRRGKLFCKGL